MKINNIDKTQEAENLAWDMFSKTGNIGYYLLHKNLNDNNE